MLIIKICVLLSSVAVIKCELEGFIVGGRYPIIEKIPHSAFLSYDCLTVTRKRKHWICGSSILNQDILLTAAHCLPRCSLSGQVVARVGNVDNTKGAMSSVLMVLLHENYDTEAFSFDIALVRLKTRLKLDWRVSRVALMRNLPYNERAAVAGWGRIDEINKKYDRKIKYLEQRVWKNKDCKKIIINKPAGTICASAYNNDKKQYASNGDSGSALVVRGYIQIGLVSYKIPSKARYLVVYTDAGYYYNWIRKNAKTIYCMK